MHVRTIAFALVGIFVYASVSHAQMSSANFQIRWDSISSGGSDTSNSASYILRDNVSTSDGERATGTAYQMDSGYRSGIFDEIITFELLIQNTASVRAATAYAGGTMSASPDGISVTDYIVLIQDRGTNQVVGLGKVSSTGINTITVDALTTAGVDPVIDGTNDYVYELTGAALAFGDLSDSVVGTTVVGFEITAENSNGYVVQVFEDGNLRNGAEVINDVADGAVTAGAEEYGARSSDSTIATSTFDTQDSAITTSGQSVVTSSGASFNERRFITVKVAIDGSTQSGAYGHTLTFIASGNF